MRRFEINRISGVFESTHTTELLLDSTAGNLLIVFRRDGGDLLDGVATALSALKTVPDGHAPPGSALSQALEHLREALALLEGAERESFARIARTVLERPAARSTASKAEVE